jgi:preprotein translocase SecF subunit
MYQLVQKRRLYFTLSGILILLGILAMGYSLATEGSIVKLSIDFTGGSLFEIQFIASPEEHIQVALSEYVAETGAEVAAEGDAWKVTIDPETPDDLRADVLEALLPLDPGLTEGENEFTLTPVASYNESSEDAIRQAFQAQELSDISVQQLGAPEEHRWQIRTEFVEEEKQSLIIDELEAGIAPLNTGTLLISRVTPTVGDEVTRAAIFAVIAVAVLILLFIAWAFRKVPNPFRFGACAIVTMFHDLLITLGVMALLGVLLGWEADALFLTAVLTVVGYSVQDTIVIFDRIRENLPRRRGEPFETIVNRSLLETIHRSLATQINAIFVMIAIVLFGGESVRQFIAILLIGLASGTYSSIFTAAPLLVAWELGEIPLLSRKSS